MTLASTRSPVSDKQWGGLLQMRQRSASFRGAKAMAPLDGRSAVGHHLWLELRLPILEIVNDIG